MLLDLLKRSDIGDVLKLCSPSLFRVLPPLGAARELRALVGSRKSADHLAIVARHVALHKGDAGLVMGAAGKPLDAAHAKTLGETVLRVYFREILYPEDTLLDLRPSAFRADGEVLHWSPAPGSVKWPPAFIEAIRGMYRGFYGGDDALFRRSLDALGLGIAADLFRQQFGEGDQHAVRFSTRDFTKTFGAIFERCAAAKVQLDASFLPLGFFLASLYQTLEQLGAAYDVRAAFDAAASPRP